MLVGFLQPFSFYLYLYFHNPIIKIKMSDIIIIYPKGSEYPKVTNENLQNANYISAVINAEDSCFATARS